MAELDPIPYNTIPFNGCMTAMDRKQEAHFNPAKRTTAAAAYVEPSVEERQLQRESGNEALLD